MDTNAEEGKTLAIIAYITIIGMLISFFMNREKNNLFVLFHVRQSLGLWLLYFIIGYLVSGFSNMMLSYSFWIFFGVLFLYGIFGAVTGKKHSVPLLGNFFQKIFNNLN